MLNPKSPVMLIALVFACLVVGLGAVLARPAWSAPPVPNPTSSAHQKGWRWVKVSAYCPGPCATCGTRGVTYTGRDAKKAQGVAVSKKQSRRVAPIGSLVKIKGLGVFRVDDVGGGVARNHLDLRMSSHREAVKFGTQWRKVRL